VIEIIDTSVVVWARREEAVRAERARVILRGEAAICGPVTLELLVEADTTPIRGGARLRRLARPSPPS